ncbi:hypothetical protein [Pseudomonas sp. NMS19W]|uniref:hypothetical protein n=1 Tax=Pseudomonas sp. NMS19W TaxID=3079768 RepID=UPI003F655FDF
MPKHPLEQTASAAEIQRSIQTLNRMAESLWGDGRLAEAVALINALDDLSGALDKISKGDSGEMTLH